MKQPRIGLDRPVLPAPLVAAAGAVGARAQQAYVASGLARRVELAREIIPEEHEAGKPKLARMLGEADVLLEPFRRPRRKLDIAATANPQMVMVLPGFATHPVRMRYLAQAIEAAGHRTKRWGLGFNWGADEERFELLEARLADLHARHGRPVVLLGWSLGGLFARELAKRQPGAVAKVITMGSPFSGSPRANNVWRAYQFIAGHSVDAPPVETDLAAKPPMETVALWSPNDGVIAPRCAAGRAGERDRAIALRCTHIGFTYDPQVIAALLAELEVTR
ncbi:esterase/lipase family protein [Erythrobacter dokdonensis]|uniref:Alpha/beta hydrolase fold protein n=1 Tax=Erythrobacter dokdonensis DSW-74 TaxID=1300349 RepID=A0A1A7BLF9_9SPHN|nr:alpha/beta hydrolase [Erythrobacter dokdonensis]OBV12000.1 alpha/beta hydrolase fold protein [Erythrobacter dokdonensis DSW-74]